MQYHVQRAAKLCQPMPDSSPHSPANPVALHRAAKHLSHRKSYSRTRSISPLQIKGNHVSGNPLLALPVDSLKISMLQQPRVPGKALREVCALLGHSERLTLVPVTWFYRNSFASFGPAAGKDCLAAFGLHAGPESVGLGPVAAVRLKRALRHAARVLLLKNFCAGQTRSIKELRHITLARNVFGPTILATASHCSGEHFA